ncbi:MAG: transglutaminase-like domain-containing protein [candidate division KSB1 bacterium]|nr:transglutaminase-like domain-containing protein [candidate division KSB1 bacterium]MDZ7413012.1 transglutaminase-like domain-containing protein [candidate division KSB1 bacterium]
MGLWWGSCWAQQIETRPAGVYTNPRTWLVDFSWKGVAKPSTQPEEGARAGKEGQSCRLLVWISRPRSWDEQWAHEPRWQGARPALTFVDPHHGNLIDAWVKEIGLAGDSLIIRRSMLITSFEVTYAIDPEQVGSYDRRSELVRRYTRSEDGIQAGGQVRRLAREAVGEERNPYLCARLLFRWIVANMSYADKVERYDVREALSTGSGDSALLAMLFVAMCRAVDIPARIVCGHYTTGDRGAHVWAEFYLPNYGWVPADPAAAERASPSQATEAVLKRYFAHLDNERIIVSKGTNILLWPRVRGRWLRNFGLEPSGTSRLMVISDFALEGVAGKVRHSYTWSFEER